MPTGTSLFRVHLETTPAAPASGRLLLFAEDARVAEQGSRGKVTEVDANPFAATQTTVTARDVSWLAPHRSVVIDGDDQAFPSGYSSLPAGEYYVQAVLDVNHDYNYRGRSGGDLISKVVKIRLPLKAPMDLVLDQTVPVSDPWHPAGAGAEQQKLLDTARPHMTLVDFPSQALTAFWGRQIKMRGWVLTPPGYDGGKERYPTVYYTQGFGGDNARAVAVMAKVYAAMQAGSMPPMIWVALDESSPTGTHEFADSVNNGPWGQALTTELIPALERQYRMDGKAQGRFLNGHSSGGWATLWLQTRYPGIFGGTWSTSPDPSDFHDFTGPDLYAPHANVYFRADGSPWPLVRDHERVLGTFEQFARMEQVIGPYGGQMASFEWVFSPRGPDGRPMPMFNRHTGAVDPVVVRYWRDHYDIAWRLARDWPALKADLDGKIHLYVGTADTFYLDGAAHRLKQVLDSLGARSDIRFLPGKTHMDLYVQGDDRLALLKQISWDMYAVARPGAHRPAAM
ncbi:alpha/beta hydrolase [Frateuria aurantia]